VLRYSANNAFVAFVLADQMQKQASHLLLAMSMRTTLWLFFCAPAASSSKDLRKKASGSAH